MDIADFDYQLPPELIAQEPSLERPSSRLMVLDRKEKRIQHHTNFSEICSYFQAGDVLVLNNTKVVAARLIGQRMTGARSEMLILDCSEDKATAMIQTRKRPQIGENYLLGDVKVKVIGKNERGWEVDFLGQDVREVMEKIGYPPLPPYIKRKGNLADEFASRDLNRYQTVYAKEPGAIAAPTAGLHFTEELLEQLQAKGVEVAYVTLHVGVGTFLPVRTDKVEDHEMQSEKYEVSEATSKVVNKALAEKRRVIAVGTTTCRTLETAQKDGYLPSGQGDSRLYIYPGFQFQIISGLVTNFHLPKSTLILLVSAFAGKDFIFRAYEEAILEKYRFYSYGDAMILL